MHMQQQPWNRLARREGELIWRFNPRLTRVTMFVTTLSMTVVCIHGPASEPGLSRAPTVEERVRRS